MRFALFTLILLTAFPAAACEGYNNAMNALESAIADAKPKTTYAQTPPIASINHSLDQLEKAIAENKAKKQESAPRTVQKKL